MIGRMKIYLKDSEYKKHKSTEKLHEIQYRTKNAESRQYT